MSYHHGSPFNSVRPASVRVSLWGAAGAALVLGVAYAMATPVVDAARPAIASANAAQATAAQPMAAQAMTKPAETFYFPAQFATPEGEPAEQIATF